MNPVAGRRGEPHPGPGLADRARPGRRGRLRQPAAGTALPALPTSDGRTARATTAGGSLYLTLCGPGRSGALGVTGLALPPDHDVRLLGHGEPLRWSSEGGSLRVELPPEAPRPPVLRITPAPALRTALRS